MKKFLMVCSILAFAAAGAYAGEPPRFFKDTYPEHALKSALDARGVLAGESAQLDGKTRALIALGVSAQIPCHYCVYSHTKNARAKGASSGTNRRRDRLRRRGPGISQPTPNGNRPERIGLVD